MALTDIQVKKAKAKDKPYRLTDGGGLYLWLTPAGGKLWRWGYVYQDKEKLMSFGKYPDVALAMARERHAEARKLLAANVDPMAQRKAEKIAVREASENSFASVAAHWLEHWQEGKSPRHVDSTRRRLNSNILPILGSRPTTEIEELDIVAMVKAIEKRGAPDIAKRTLQITGQIFGYARVHGHAKRNPARAIRPSDVLKATRTVNYARIDAKQLPDFLKKLEIYQGTHRTRLAMKLMALTFVRTSELICATWEEFDLEGARWDIPAARMKMRTPHIVPLSTQALEVLDALRTLSGESEWVFPGEGKAKHMSNNTILKGLALMGYKGLMTGHGFRGLASTILHEQGYAHDHIETQLAHCQRNAVSAAYNHALYLKPRAKMMQEWADFLEHTQRSAKVLPFKGTAA